MFVLASIHRQSYKEVFSFTDQHSTRILICISELVKTSHTHPSGNVGNFYLASPNLVCSAKLFQRNRVHLGNKSKTSHLVTFFFQRSKSFNVVSHT